MVVYRGIDMNKKLKYSLHSFSNRMTLPCLGVMFTIAYYFIYRDAYNEVLRWIGIASLSIILILVFILFIYYFRILDYLLFTNENIILCSFFRKNLSFQYSDYIWQYGVYSSTIEKKQIIIFSPKKLGKVFNCVDTSRLGNCIYLNKNHVLYCQHDNMLELILNEKYIGK